MVVLHLSGVQRYIPLSGMTHETPPPKFTMLLRPRNVVEFVILQFTHFTVTDCHLGLLCFGKGAGDTATRLDNDRRPTETLWLASHPF